MDVYNNRGQVKKLSKLLNGNHMDLDPNGTGVIERLEYDVETLKETVANLLEYIVSVGGMSVQTAFLISGNPYDMNSYQAAPGAQPMTPQPPNPVPQQPNIALYSAPPVQPCQAPTPPPTFTVQRRVENVSPGGIMTYDYYVSQGWTEQMLIDAGLVRAGMYVVPCPEHFKAQTEEIPFSEDLDHRIKMDNAFHGAAAEAQFDYNANQDSSSSDSGTSE